MSYHQGIEGKNAEETRDCISATAEKHVSRVCPDMLRKDQKSRDE
jgi:hypothetical protein